MGRTNTAPERRCERVFSLAGNHVLVSDYPGRGPGVPVRQGTNSEYDRAARRPRAVKTTRRRRH